MDEVVAIQQLYPQIFHACHVEHTRARTNAERLSQRDSAILAHVEPGSPSNARDLARHMGIGAPTMSAALARLERAGYLERAPRDRDRRVRELRLTDRGQRAMSATSVLDAGRVAALLERLTAGERKRAVEGLRLLAQAARAFRGREATA